MATRLKRTRKAKARAPRPRRITPEGAVLREVMDFLAAHRILHFRMNVGAHKLAGGRFVRYGLPGMADVLAFPKVAWENGQEAEPFPLWIECKAGKGKQSMEQSVFEQCVKGEGHWYVVVRDSYELEAFLKQHGII